jgi:hypothetical protein
MLFDVKLRSLRSHAQASMRSEDRSIPRIVRRKDSRDRCGLIPLVPIAVRIRDQPGRSERRGSSLLSDHKSINGILPPSLCCSTHATASGVKCPLVATMGRE